MPLTAELRDALIERAHQSGYIFGKGEEGNPPSQEATSNAFGRIARGLNLKGVSHPVLRHTGASVMLTAGISIRTVQEIGGCRGRAQLKVLSAFDNP